MWNLWYVAAFALFAAVAIAQGRTREASALEAAARWLRAHGYRAHRRMSPPWFAAPKFPGSPWRDTDDAFDFRFAVEDGRLGGAGIVWLRAWPDWRGHVQGELEVWWEQMPAGATVGAPADPERSYEAAQLALIERVAAGETIFRPDARDDAAGERFDMLVEHLLAMQQRGLVTLATPVAELRRPGRRYAAVRDVALTPEGARIASHARGDHRARPASPLGPSTHLAEHEHD
jgi:hypothetical protein